MKKNCINCIHLDFYEGNEYDGEGPNGNYCKKKEYLTRSEEKRHLENMQDNEYLEKPKRCFEGDK